MLDSSSNILGRVQSGAIPLEEIHDGRGDCFAAKNAARNDDAKLHSTTI
jgi:hypothetical protein